MLRPIKIIISGVDNFSKKFEESSAKMKKLGKSFSSAGKKMTAGVTAPLIGAGLASLKLSTNMNALMASVQTLSLSSERTLELKRNVQDLAIATGMSTEVVAKGLYDIVSAFGDSADTVEMLNINARSAAAGLATVQEAIGLTSAVTKGYGDTSADATRKVSDLAFETLRLGQTSYSDLAQSIGRVVPLSSALGISQEELFAVFATATGVTGKAAEVTTQFRGILQALMSPTADMTKLYKRNGIASGEALIKQRGLAGALTFVTDSAKKARIPLQSLIGSINGQTLAMALTGAQAETWAQKYSEIQMAAGATDRAFKAQTEGINKLGFSLAQMQQKIIVFAQKFGDAITPTVLSLIDSLEPLVDVISKTSPAVLKTIALFGGLVAAIGPLLVVVGSLLPLFTSVMGAVGSAGGVLALLSNPVGWVIAGLVALAAAVTFIVRHWESKWAKLISIVFPLAGVVGFIVRNWSKLKPFLLTYFLPLRLILEGLWFTAKWVFGGIASFVSSVLTPLENFIEKILNGLLKIGQSALPDWVKKRIGLDATINTSAPDEMMQKVSSVEASKSEFKGTLKIVGAPGGSSVQTEQGSMDVSIDNGVVMGGAF